jgi:hypothetical protein
MGDVGDDRPMKVQEGMGRNAVRGTRYSVRRLSSRGASVSERRAIPQGGISHETGQNLPVRLAGSSLETGIKTDGMSAGDLLFYSGVAELCRIVNSEY